VYRVQETTVRSPKKGHGDSVRARGSWREWERDGERDEGDREGGMTKTTRSLARWQGGMISEEGPKGCDWYLVR